MAEMSQASEASSQANVSDKPVYEAGIHIIPTVAEADLGPVLEKIRGALSMGETEIIREEFPARRTLAYTIERAAAGKREKFTESYFGFIKFATDRENIPTVTAALRAMHEIMRFLVIETVREEAVVPRRAVFSSDRLEGETIKKPAAAPEAGGEISEEELNKSIDALVS